MPHFAGRYETFEQLGKGGYGAVFRCFDHNLGRELALKIFHGRATEVLAVHEARILTYLEGDHILRVFNAGVHQDVPFLATAIAANGSAEDYLAQQPGIAPDLAVRWTRHLLVGLRVAHDANLLHRDITPSNVFLDSVDHARLGDFGVATNRTAAGRAGPAGNPYVRPPEAITDNHMTRLSDVWAAGVTSWRLLTGTWPFDAATEADLFNRIVSGARPRLRDQAPHVPQRLALAIERALELDPGERYQEAAAMDDALSRIPVLTRIWTEVAVPTAGRRWIGSSRVGNSEIEVTAEPHNQGRLQITTQHVATNRRLREHCDIVTPSQLARRLRRIFDSL